MQQREQRWAIPDHRSSDTPSQSGQIPTPWTPLALTADNCCGRLKSRSRIIGRGIPPAAQALMPNGQTVLGYQVLSHCLRHGVSPVAYPEFGLHFLEVTADSLFPDPQ